MRGYSRFWRKKLWQAANKGSFRSLSHAAASLRRTAQRSIHKRPGPALAGTPPHTRNERLRKAILYSVDRRAGSAVIGPTRSMIGPAGAAHEHGGPFRGRDYPARPFMGPALRATQSRLPRMWANSLRG